MRVAHSRRGNLVSAGKTGAIIQKERQDMTGSRLRVLGLLAGLLLVTGQAAATAVANFDDGNTGAAVDGYAGIAGGGWSNAWVQPITGGAWTTGPTVVSTTPLAPGGGNYLTATMDSAGAANQATVSRSFANIAGIDASLPHVVSFQFRVEDLTNFTSNEDRFFMFDRTSASAGTNASCSWIILGNGATRGDTNWNALEWTFFDGDKLGGGFYVNSYVNSGIPLAAGTTYNFTVAVHPSAQEWDVTVSDGTNSFTALNLGFRINATQAGAALNFGGRASSSADFRSFSLDAVRVALPDTIRAEFDAGMGSSNPDQFTGTAGKGWLSPWTGVGGTASIQTSAPLEGAGDPYLQAVRTASGARTLRRQYGNYGLLDPAARHYISWKWRFDGNLADLTTFADRVHFFGDNSAESSTGAGNSWIIGWIAADRVGNDIYEGQWYFFDGTSSSGFVSANMVNTGLNLLAATTYDFRVLVDPANGTYDAWIDDGTNSFYAAGLGFRNQALGVYDWVHFGTYADSAADDTTFSLDSVRITAWTPEPGTLTLLLLGGAVGLVRRRRRS